MKPGAATFEVVLVEDNTADTYLFERALRAAGLRYHLQSFEDGALALDFVRACTSEARPDAFVIDLNLPKAGGKEILSALRKSRALALVPALVITSSPSPDDRREIERLGATFITKPDNLDDFMRIGYNVKAVLEGSRTSP
jgi:CheY-like chemotaxis protein